MLSTCSRTVLLRPEFVCKAQQKRWAAGCTDCSEASSHVATLDPFAVLPQRYEGFLHLRRHTGQLQGTSIGPVLLKDIPYTSMQQLTSLRLFPLLLQQRQSQALQLLSGHAQRRLMSASGTALNPIGLSGQPNDWM